MVELGVKKELGEEGTNVFHCCRAIWGRCRRGRTDAWGGSWSSGEALRAGESVEDNTDGREQRDVA
jgi:hypothetical protein